MRIAALFLGLLLATSPLHANLDPSGFRNLAFKQHPGAQLPLDAALTDSTGRPQTLRVALSGHPAIVILEYLRCRNLCSLVLSGAVKAIAAAGLVPGRDLDLVAISIDPRETFADAARAEALYAHRLFPTGSTQGVRFFTARPDQVSKIAATIGFPYRYDPQTGQFAHPAGFVVTTPNGRISSYVLGLYPSPTLVKQALAEASLDKVEPPAHPLLLLCFGYDPDASTAAILAMRLVRWSAFALVAALAAMIGFLSLRRRSA